MDVELLRALVAVAEERHFGRAATRLCVSTPALSHRIKRLEKLAGARLVDRSPVELTPVGASLLAHARRTIASADATAAHLAAVRTGARATLRVGVLSHGGGEVMAATLRAFSSRHPQVTLALRALTFPEAASAVKDGDVDVAFVRPSLGDDALREHPVLVEQRYAILPSWDDRARLPHVGIPDIERDRFLSPADGSPRSYRAFLHLLSDRNGERPRTVDSQCRNAEEFLTAVSSGIGIATTVRSFTRHYSWPGVAYVPIRGAAHASTVAVVDAGERRAPVQSFVEQLRETRARLRPTKPV